MQGYIYLQTHPDYPDQVLLRTQDTEPTPNDQPPTTLHYIAHFTNAHIAYMHVHDTLKRHMVSLNDRRYRCSLPHAIAAIEAKDLKQQRCWIAPELAADDDAQQQIAAQIHQLQQRQQRIHRRYLMAGGVGIILLMFILLGGVWRV